MKTCVLTATITDSDGQTWNDGKWKMSLYSPKGTPMMDGVALTGEERTLSGTLGSAGILSTNAADTSLIYPTGALWTFTIAPNASEGTFTVNLPVTGDSMDLSGGAATPFDITPLSLAVNNFVYLGAG